MAIEGPSRKEWTAIMARCVLRGPGVTLRQFAEDEGVSFNAIVYRLYEKGVKRRRPRQELACSDVRLLPVELPSSATLGSKADPPARWLEAETVRGIRLRFMEGTGSEYVADLMSRMAARGM